MPDAKMNYIGESEKNKNYEPYGIKAIDGVAQILFPHDVNVVWSYNVRFALIISDICFFFSQNKAGNYQKSE